jgi:hypothetical protein
MAALYTYALLSPNLRDAGACADAQGETADTQVPNA